MIDYYRLDEYRQPIPCQDYTQAYKDRYRLHTRVFGYLVSTVFLGMNHAYDNGPPMIFETMVFHGSWEDRYMTRCSTFPQALGMHIKGCTWAVKESIVDFVLNRFEVNP